MFSQGHFCHQMLIVLPTHKCFTGEKDFLPVFAKCKSFCVTFLFCSGRKVYACIERLPPYGDNYS